MFTAICIALCSPAAITGALAARLFNERRFFRLNETVLRSELNTFLENLIGRRIIALLYFLKRFKRALAAFNGLESTLCLRFINARRQEACFFTKRETRFRGCLIGRIFTGGFAGRRVGALRRKFYAALKRRHYFIRLRKLIRTHEVVGMCITDARFYVRCVVTVITTGVFSTRSIGRSLRTAAGTAVFLYRINRSVGAGRSGSSKSVFFGKCLARIGVRRIVAVCFARGFVRAVAEFRNRKLNVERRQRECP